MITVEPQGGLGNRLRVIHSAVQLSRAVDNPLTIKWVESGGLHCPFHALFKNSSDIIVREVKNSIFRKAIRYLLKNQAGKMIKKSLYDFYLTNNDVYNLLKSRADFAGTIQNKNNIYIKTHQYFYDGIGEFYAPEPSDKILDRVSEITQNFGTLVIGVHIRGTDNKRSIEMSPVSLFIEKIHEQLANHPETLFYLSTDSEEAKNEIYHQFGDERIIKQKEITLHRDSREGIEDALVDMLCLSRTKMIYGSYWSSFSSVAASIGRIKKETLKIKE
jgi:hypothetical protein